MPALGSRAVGLEKALLIDVVCMQPQLAKIADVRFDGQAVGANARTRCLE